MTTPVAPAKSYIPDVIAAGYGYFIVDSIKYAVAEGFIKDDENLLQEAEKLNTEMYEEAGSHWWG